MDGVVDLVQFLHRQLDFAMGAERKQVGREDDNKQLKRKSASNALDMSCIFIFDSNRRTNVFASTANYGETMGKLKFKSCSHSSSSHAMGHEHPKASVVRMIFIELSQRIFGVFFCLSLLVTSDTVAAATKDLWTLCAALHNCIRSCRDRKCALRIIVIRKQQRELPSIYLHIAAFVGVDLVSLI